MKKVAVKILTWIDSKTSLNLMKRIRKMSGQLIVSIFRLTGVNLLHIALKELGIHKGIAFEESGELFLVTKILVHHIEPDETLVDVGANIGGYSKVLKHYFGKNRIVSFEPNPTAFSELQKIDGIEAIQSGCGNKNAQRALHFAENSTASTHASFSGNQSVYTPDTDYIEVNCTRLDNEIDRLGLKPIGFVKIDTEGHDYEVIEGMGNKLKEIKFIQFEFNEFHIHTRTFIRDFHNILSNSHDLFRLDTYCLHDLRIYHPYQEIFRFQNIVAIRKDLTDRVEYLIK